VILRSVVAPVLSAFLLCAALAIFAAWKPVPRPPPAARLSRANLRPFLLYIAGLAVGGYVAFLAVVFVFSTVIIGQEGALRNAAWSGLFLLAVAVPAFAVLSWAFGRRG
jgi:hypothetical protein